MTPKHIANLKNRIIRRFKSQPGRIWYFSDLAYSTGGRLEDVVRVCKELIGKGKIKVSDKRLITLK